MSPTSFFLPQVLLLSMMSDGMEYPFGQLGSAVLAVSPQTQLLVHPQPPHWRGRVRSKKGFGTVSALLSNN